MTKNLVTMIAVAMLSTSAFAGILKTTAGDKSIEGIQIAKEGTVSVGGQDLPVSIIGAGLRKKKVAIMQVKVYVAELLSSDASKFVRTDAEALNSLEQSRTIALRLNFVRTVDAPTVQTSFSEALNANSINVSEGAISQFLTAVKEGGEATSGKSLTIITQKNADKTETVYYEDSNGKVSAPIKGPEGFSKKIMSIWLGKAADAGIESMKQDLIKGL